MRPTVRRVGREPVDPSSVVFVENRRFTDEDLSGQKLLSFAVSGSRFERCRFDNSSIDSASFGAGRRVSTYVDCSFDGSEIGFGPGGFARFERCSFQDVFLHDWFCFTVELIECTFSGRMRKAVFNGTVPDDDRKFVRRLRNEFRGNDFSRCELIEVAFRTGIDLSRQRLPVGPNYIYLRNAAQALGDVETQVASWPTEERSGVRALLMTLESALEGGQDDLFLRPADLAGDSIEDRVISLLREHSGQPETT